MTLNSTTDKVEVDSRPKMNCHDLRMRSAIPRIVPRTNRHAKTPTTSSQRSQAVDEIDNHRCRPAGGADHVED